MLRERAATIPDETALIYGPDDTHVSYEQLDTTANRIANGLRRLGVERGSNVSLMAAHPLQTLYGMFGINKAGGVYSPINFEYEGETLSYQLDDTDPDVFVLEDRYLERFEAVRDDLETEPELVVIETDGPSRETSLGTTSFDALREEPATDPDVDVSWHDTASIVYTSGTTGMPKGVVIPHRWIFANYIAPKRAVLNGDDVVHTSLPLYHIGGVYADVVAGLVAGGTVALWNRFSPREFWDRIETYEATSVTLISVMMPWLMNAPRTESDHENTLNKVHMQPLPEEYEALAERFGFEIVTVAFAQTETGSPIVGVVRTDDAGGTPRSYRRGLEPETVEERAREMNLPVVDGVDEERYMGRVRDDIVEVAVLDEHDQEVETGEVGELCVRPRQPGLLLERYHAKPGRTAEATTNLWFHTGDAAYRDEDGDFYFVDRLGDVIRRRGENISSMQIQDAVASHESVDAAAVFPVPAPEGGEDRIALAVEPRGDESVTEATLRSHLEGRIPSFMHPDETVVVDEIPTTETNKMRKVELRDQLFDD
ncbi:acyl-CoA synthetase (AMP-forming)/AMP-acid ligase II [Natronolimnohabitans innermongolicus JCM 12255]|uniref:Acyl-CoA synthetase (AMP-forming)/AMP-acid ligase II n=2 Tax=Natronolimnohabitans innermongolicus TaxID=253107 RepID=L9WRI9_9EURY|nr:acyl-CoA synthetase (AMP-forming)/AMP-acid ligase II [Natronolimnohabitans innermongolicus JCM 12255]